MFFRAASFTTFHGSVRFIVDYFPEKEANHSSKVNKISEVFDRSQHSSSKANMTQLVLAGALTGFSIAFIEVRNK